MRPKTRESTIISARIKEDTKKKLFYLAHLHGQSQSAFIEQLIETAYKFTDVGKKNEALKKELASVQEEKTRTEKFFQEKIETIEHTINSNQERPLIKELEEKHLLIEKQKYVMLLQNMLRTGRDFGEIREFATNQSTFLNNKWTKEELLAEAYTKNKEDER